MRGPYAFFIPRDLWILLPAILVVRRPDAAKATPLIVVGAVIGAIAGGGKGAAIGAGVGAGAGTAVQVATKGDQVHVPSETLLEFALDQPVTIPISQTR